jgi:molecular chaperone DnaK (HSP70)
VVLGQWARQLGAQVPGRLVSSAKSWLSHPGVDRQAAILPWGAAADVPKVSPVEASASYLRHVRHAWDQQFPQYPLAQQDLVLTVPASFDEGARALTLSAARLAGLPTLRLLEEPQAVFYDWLWRHRAHLATELTDSHRVLVCDVGGGTTDLSLIQVELVEGEPKLTRIGVGNHLMLGGDNMDLALAHLLEGRLSATGSATVNPARLSASQLAQLIERCRVAKEHLLATDAPEQLPVTLLGGGSRLIGGSRSATLTRQEVEQLVVDGFFPQVASSDTATQARQGLVEFGLPFARDPAVTRHLADFLRQHDHAMPDTLLLNGGVFRAEALVKRLAQTLGAWRGAALHLLHNDNPDVAVARGAVAYGLAQHGLAPKIGGGSARSYFLLLDDAGAASSTGSSDPTHASGPVAPAGPRGICILPRGSDTGEEVLLAGHTFALRLGQPVRFQLFSTVADAAEHTPFELGDQLSLGDERFVQLPPIATVLEAASAGNISARGLKALQEMPVQLVSVLTEVGTLEVHCQSLADTAARWLLAFDLRHQPSPPAAADHAGEPLCPSGPLRRGGAPKPPSLSRVSIACQQINRVFGAGGAALPTKEVKQLRQQLEAILGERARWATSELRQLFDALWQHARGRKRSVEHERAWLNLAGFCLRPGFGDPLDAWRLQQLWTQFEAGVQHSKDKQVCAEWWTLWRRVAGGLAATEQLRLLDDFGYNLHTNERGPLDGAAKPVKGSDDDSCVWGLRWSGFRWTTSKRLATGYCSACKSRWRQPPKILKRTAPVTA